MKKGNNWKKKLIKTTDILNTINGGMVMPQIDFKKLDDHYEVSVWVPGIKAESLHVEVNNNILDIYALLNILPGGFKYNISKVDIPFDVDITKISANYSDKSLIVDLPFNELSRGYHKKVWINKDN